ncbi:MAG TPA: SMP-30/gluconolactonase/LRE family protein [Ktedonobacteraceae bacterium]|jgi:sugar lactone lactonase YvrE
MKTSKRRSSNNQNAPYPNILRTLIKDIGYTFREVSREVEGLSPNGIVISQDWHTLYVANTYADSITAFSVNNAGQVMDSGHTFAQNLNDDLEEYPTGFDALVLPDTKIGAAASTPLNGPDGLALDSQGRIWVASNLSIVSFNAGVSGAGGNGNW